MQLEQEQERMKDKDHELHSKQEQLHRETAEQEPHAQYVAGGYGWEATRLETTQLQIKK